ncbi:MAG: hypothetical protein KatS3mg031_0873 [Chitinophagales bacterium]|nr:MAG: hypothetical protein KatS3mg031_0873 [Chitinophagales bacterium]
MYDRIKFFHLIMSALLWVPLHTGAQPFPDRSYTDCNGLSESIYQVLSQGKSLLIVSTGFDCLICRNEAPDVEAFAAQHTQVRVWGAMNFRYLQALPTCGDISAWNNDYHWDHIFQFTDNQDEWVGSGFPTYHVISPRDSSAYQTINLDDAIQKALSEALTTTTQAAMGQNSFRVYASQEMLWLTVSGKPERNSLRVQMYDISGRVVLDKQITFNGGQPLFLERLFRFSSGIHLLRITDQGQIYSQVMIVLP